MVFITPAQADKISYLCETKNANLATVEPINDKGLEQFIEVKVHFHIYTLDPEGKVRGVLHED